MSYQTNNLIQVHNENIIDNKKIISAKRKPKEKVILTPEAEKFQTRFYKFLTNGEKKVVRKEFIYMYHDMIRQKYHSLRNISREEYRSIKKYFNAFVDQEMIIMKGLHELKEQGKLVQNTYYPITLINNY